MADDDLIERLEAMPSLAEIPRDELVWLVAHGQLEVHETGAVVSRKGEPIEKLWIMMSGHMAINVDRGAGPRRVMEWRKGDVSGILPYSRMTGPPGDNFVEETAEVLTVHQECFHELVHRCPKFAAHTVHIMVDRARSFNTSDLQDEKMISLGKLAAGLAHELNNPASALVRSTKQLLGSLAETEAAARALGAAGLSDALLKSLERLRSAALADPGGNAPSPLQLVDREEALTVWLEEKGLDATYAAQLAEMAVTVEAADAFAAETTPDALAIAVRWIGAILTTDSLASDIEHSANRIYELVASVKQFTYMDKRGGLEAVDVESGLRDTIRVLESKRKAKGATIEIEIGPELPPARGNGAELNQVWMNLIDNALDAIPDGGRIEIGAARELERVVVEIIDDGAGIPEDALPKIFDPFFTTKAPGQGTGLGLEITRRLVRQHEGDITVKSRPGRTEFRVNLAIAEPGMTPSG